VSSAVDAGAKAYLTASETHASLVRALGAIAQGETHFSKDVQERLTPPSRNDGFAEVKFRPRLGLLTPREVEVLTCIAQALSKKEIAKRLNRSPKTIDNHTTNLMNKLDIHDRVELTLFAIREGLATP
jgi:DNA-binding NarL/FixJ family response regulator